MTTDVADDDGDDDVPPVGEVGEEGDAGSPQLVGRPGDDDDKSRTVTDGTKTVVMIRKIYCNRSKIHRKFNQQAGQCGMNLTQLMSLTEAEPDFLREKILT